MAKKETIIELPVKKIEKSIFLTRRIRKPDIEEMTKNIKETGIIQPVIVRKKKKGMFELILGYRRTVAASGAGLENIPAIVKDVDDKQVLFLILSSNMHQENLNPFEEALLVHKLMKNLKVSVKEIAKKTGKKDKEIDNLIKLLSLHEKVQQYVHDGKLTLGKAVDLANLSPREQVETAKIIVENELTDVELAEFLSKKKYTKSSFRSNSNRRDGYTRNSSGLKIALRLKENVLVIDSVLEHINSFDEEELPEIEEVAITMIIKLKQVQKKIAKVLRKSLVKA